MFQSEHTSPSFIATGSNGTKNETPEARLSGVLTKAFTALSRLMGMLIVALSSPICKRESQERGKRRHGSPTQLPAEA